MNKPSRSGFVHSVKVPRIYKTASVIAKKVVEEGGSLKDLVYSSGHKNIKGVYALVVETIKHSKELDRLITVSKLLKNETRLQPWLARILLTELLFGKKELKGESKPVQTVLLYKKQFEKLLKKGQNTSRDLKSTVKKPRYVRVNTLHHTPDEIIKLFRNEGWTFVPCPSNYLEFITTISSLNDNFFTKDFHIKELLVFPGSAQFYENELYHNGSILLQDKASCLPAFLLQPTPNSVALDMCAAPGMKTTHLSALMRNKGKIYATEIDPKRHKVLCDVVRNAGCTNVTTLNFDALKLKQSEDHVDTDLTWCSDVEYILVDPSCSGSGIVERINVFVDEKNDPKRLKKLRGFQFKLLEHALTNFPKVKRVVYSTCSVHPLENEAVVEDAIRMLKDLESDAETGKENSHVKFRLGRPLEETWTRRGSDEYEHGKFCIFSDPKEDLTNGFFIAVFERIEDGDEEITRATEKEKKKKEKKMNRKKEDESVTECSELVLTESSQKRRSQVADIDNGKESQDKKRKKHKNKHNRAEPD